MVMKGNLSKGKYFKSLAIENAPMYGIFLDEEEYCSPKFGTMKQAGLIINSPQHISIPIIKDKILWCLI
jgi:hypothetical protein